MGKNVNNCLIIGDSYSTFEGCVPVGYAVYYTTEGKGPEHPATKMNQEETWWSRMLSETGATIVQNNSWSGSTICYTGYEGRDCSMSSSFIYRYRQLRTGGFFEKNKVDTLFVFGATNDSWSNAPLGEMKFEGFVEKDLYQVLPAICYFMKTLKAELPEVRIVFIANCDIKKEITDCMKAAGEKFGVEVIELSGVDKLCGHPTPLGMKNICDQVLSALKSNGGKMNLKKITKICGNQDGAIFAHELFRFNTKGDCTVFDLRDIARGEEALSAVASFRLDRARELAPHSNAVFFGKDRYEEGDEFPLLYSNVYNNYKNAEDPMLGVCLAYRLTRTDGGFSTELVQMIRIGFVEDVQLWRASEEAHGERPYGNFVMDTDGGALWAFVMRNEEKGTRFFRFDAPSPHDGEMGADGIRRVVLSADDIKEYFDMPYYRFVQGAIYHDGKIYSTEGFENDMVNRPAIRVVDVEKREEEYYDLTAHGMFNEAEMIDFYQDQCFYSDANGSVYLVRF